MQIVWWFIGVMATWTMLKFVLMVFKRLGSKTSMNDVIDRMEDGMNDAAEKIAKSVKSRRNRRKEEREERERPIVTIR